MCKTTAQSFFVLMFWDDKLSPTFKASSGSSPHGKGRSLPCLVVTRPRSLALDSCLAQTGHPGHSSHHPGYFSENIYILNYHIRPPPISLHLPTAGELRLHSKIAIQPSWSGAQAGRQQGSSNTENFVKGQSGGVLGSTSCAT